jgi:hypothetical protein
MADGTLQFASGKSPAISHLQTTSAAYAISDDSELSSRAQAEVKLIMMTVSSNSLILARAVADGALRRGQIRDQVAMNIPSRPSGQARNTGEAG